ncbi:MAG: NADH:flavin oxidoreductase [Methanobacteriota archaeon]
MRQKIFSHENISETRQIEKDPLATPFTINTLTIKNRLVRSATMENMVDEHGVATPQYIDLYERLSKGGTGLIISGHMFVDVNGRSTSGMTGAHSDEQVPQLRRTTDVVHEHGAKIFAQLNHVGFKALPEKNIGKKIVAPSKTRRATALTSTEITDIIHAFGESAARVKRAGFDGIQIHGAHSYLIAQFLSRWVNRRRDEYGGSLRNRQRFCLEVYERIRDEVGSQYPVCIKLDSYSYTYASTPPMVPLIRLKDSLDTGKRLEQEGIDGIEVSCGFNATRGAMPYKAALTALFASQGKQLQAAATNVLLSPVDVFLNRRFWFSPHHNLNHIRAFKQALNVPIMGGSCFRNPDVMRRVLDQGDMDMVCMSRPLIINPEFPKQIFSGLDEPSKCINCNLCLLLLPLRQPLQCYNGKPPPLKLS